MAHSRLASPTATRAVLDAHGLRTRKSFGQHLLIDDNIVGRIVNAAALRPDEVVLEVGPGIGTLTDALLSAGVRVVAIELDRRLPAVLAELPGAEGRLRVINGDAVSVPLGDVVFEGDPPRAFVANLPYAVAATVVLRFFAGVPELERAVVMVQSEVADRMAASPGSRVFGAYSVKLGLYARVTGTFAVPRACFLPPPRVDSAVVSFERVTGCGDDVLREAAARAADAAFSQRRKTLRNSLAAGLGISSAVAERVLLAAGMSPGDRAEVYGIPAYVELGRTLIAEGL